MMDQAGYAKWKDLQSAATEVMLGADEQLRKGDPAQWQKLWKQAIECQEVANKFARSAGAKKGEVGQDQESVPGAHNGQPGPLDS